MSMMQMLLGAGGGGETIADWFATKVYTGSTSPQTVNNGLDMVGKEGLVWMKGTSENNRSHALVGSKGSKGGDWYGWLESNSNSADGSAGSQYVSPTSNGFTINNGSLFFNPDGVTMVSWTFLKAEKFFDIISYQGDAPTEQTLSHGLGCLPGMIIVKKYDGNGTVRNWCVYHKHMDGANSKDNHMHLNTDDGIATSTHMWANTDPTTTTFKIGNEDEVNDATGYGNLQHVAYLFADDEDYIKCGAFTAPADGTHTVDLGWEPQFLLYKTTDRAGDWKMIDTVRGWTSGGTVERICANLRDDEEEKTNYISLNSDGFTTSSVGVLMGDYIYMAIRKAD